MIILDVGNKRKRENRGYKRWGWLGLVAVGLLALWVVAGLRFITFAEADEPRSSDAIYVLGPASPHRLEVGLDLIRSGYSDQLVITVSDEERELRQFCEQERDYVHCVEPDPGTTRGEAEAFAELAEQHGWSSGMVVTRRSHKSRSELLFEECFAGEITMIDDRTGSGIGYELHRFLYESAAFVKHAVMPKCA